MNISEPSTVTTGVFSCGLTRRPCARTPRHAISMAAMRTTRPSLRICMGASRHVSRPRAFASEKRAPVGFLDFEVRLQPLERFTFTVADVLAHHGGGLIRSARHERFGEIAMAMRRRRG